MAKKNTTRVVGRPIRPIPLRTIDSNSSTSNTTTTKNGKRRADWNLSDCSNGTNVAGDSSKSISRRKTRKLNNSLNTASAATGRNNVVVIDLVSDDDSEKSRSGGEDALSSTDTQGGVRGDGTTIAASRTRTVSPLSAAASERRRLHEEDKENNIVLGAKSTREQNGLLPKNAVPSAREGNGQSQGVAFSRQEAIATTATSITDKRSAGSTGIGEEVKRLVQSVDAPNDTSKSNQTEKSGATVASATEHGGVASQDTSSVQEQEEDEVVVLESKPQDCLPPLGRKVPSGSLPNKEKPGSSDTAVNDDEEVSLLGSVGGPNPLADFPHSREDCVKFPFVVVCRDTEALTTFQHERERYCDKCYCYVCDDLASKCQLWKTHCHASHRWKKWKKAREQVKERRVRQQKEKERSAVATTKAIAAHPQEKRIKQKLKEERERTARIVNASVAHAKLEEERIAAARPPTTRPICPQYYGVPTQSYWMWAHPPYLPCPNPGAPTSQPTTQGPEQPAGCYSRPTWYPPPQQMWQPPASFMSPMTSQSAPPSSWNWLQPTTTRMWTNTTAPPPDSSGQPKQAVSTAAPAPTTLAPVSSQ